MVIEHVQTQGESLVVRGPRFGLGRCLSQRKLSDELRDFRMSKDVFLGATKAEEGTVLKSSELVAILDVLFPTYVSTDRFGLGPQKKLTDDLRISECQGTCYWT